LFQIPEIVSIYELSLLEADVVQLLRAVGDEPVFILLLLLLLLKAFITDMDRILGNIILTAACIGVLWNDL
jgi:hypothetical protein